MSVAVCRDIDLSGMSAGSVPAQGSKRTIHRRPSDGSKYDGDHGYGIISILALYLQEGYLVDICLIYAMISFLAVVVLTKVYTGVYLERKEQKREEVSEEKEEKEHGNS